MKQFRVEILERIHEEFLEKSFEEKLGISGEILGKLFSQILERISEQSTATSPARPSRKSSIVCDSSTLQLDEE